MAAALPGAASGADVFRGKVAAPAIDEGVVPPYRAADHHGPSENHLPPVQSNLDLVGELEPTNTFGDIVPGQIADLAVFKNHAYLNSWNEPSCARGGTYVADISDPAAPTEQAFIPAKAGYYHGEGAQVIAMDTPAFKGDLLAVNDEACTNAATRPADVPSTAGGFDLYDVSDPAHPVTLTQNFGDRSPEGSLDQDPLELPNSYHSVFVWQDGPRAYLVASDNTELADVDIYDITDPRNPVFVNDLDLFSLPEINEILDNGAFGNAVFHHDVVVKKFGNQMRMLVSYWDAGYVQLDVDDPANATYITDTSFDGPDPLTGFDPPEGNAHEAEYSADNQFILAADEDFNPTRVTATVDGVSIGSPSVGLPDDPDLHITADDSISGTGSVWVGDACDPATIPAAPNATTVAFIERGTCDFDVKVANAEGKGYASAVIVNNVGAVDDGARCESTNGMIFDGTPPVTIKSVMVGRRDGLRMFGALPGNYVCNAGSPGTSTPAPAIGTTGPSLELAPTSDGWGYGHLYDANTSEQLDAWAIPEGIDGRFDSGFGDLSIHEFATDATEPLAYAAYYAGGMRVVSFSRADGIRQRGAFIDEDGSNFWGVEQFTTPSGERLIAGSDRDFGLQIFRYTGPGAPQPPSCSATSARTPAGTAVQVPLTCTDPNGNTLTRRIVSAPNKGTVGTPVGGSVTYTPNAGVTGTDAFTFAASDGAASSAPATATVTVQTASDYYNIPPGPPGETPSNVLVLKVNRFRHGRLPLDVTTQAAKGQFRAVLRAKIRRKGAKKKTSIRLATKARALNDGARTYHVILRVKGKKLALLRRARAKKAVKGHVNVSWTPTGGETRLISRKVRIPKR
jgi:hypothetical protein